MESLFARQHEALEYFFSKLDISCAEKFANRLWAHSLNGGIIFFSGVGKSGTVAVSNSAILNSFGIRSMPLSPLDALHGDIGIVKKQDVIIFISKSGNTQELINIIPALRHKGCSLFAITCNTKSTLAQVCDEHMLLPLLSELCPFGASPTTSTAVQILFGHTLSVFLLQTTGLTVDEYATNHPSGAIGKKLTLSVKDIMIKRSNLAICKEDAPLLEVLMQISDRLTGACILEKDGRLFGLITDGDVRRNLQKFGASIFEKSAEQFAALNPSYVTDDIKAWDALDIMQRKGVAFLPVLDAQSKVVGGVHMKTLLSVGLSPAEN